MVDKIYRRWLIRWNTNIDFPNINVETVIELLFLNFYRRYKNETNRSIDNCVLLP